MDIWQRARSFAEEAAKRSQELTLEAAKRSQELTIGGSKFADIVSETAKRSKEIAAEATKRSQELTIGGSKFSDIVSGTAKEIAAEASKRADQIKAEALKGADKIKSLAEGIAPAAKDETSEEAVNEEDLDPLRFGVTDDLREFVKEITINTFKDFPLGDDSEISDVPTISNISQDLTKWQEKHAKLVLSTVKEISKLRYELCPRFMKERKFWRIYFLLVNTHVSSYEKRYMEDLQKEVKEEQFTGFSYAITDTNDPQFKTTAGNKEDTVINCG
uniref:BSD domain-containing protein n=1 Tax=Kalanchoe fedtschenkoi TaxID=63787 RepID=A0A7N0VAN5_KALFE